MDYNKENFFKDYIAIRKIKFNKDFNTNLLQGVMYSFVDTHLGALAA